MARSTSRGVSNAFAGHRLERAPAGKAVGGCPSLFILAAAAALAWFACDLSPRKPDDPAGNSGPLVGLTDPDSVLLQIKIGLEGGFITSYINAFADEFVFHADPVDSSAGVFDNWNKDVERNTTQVILSRFTSRSVNFSTVPGESLVVEEGKVEVHENYDLLLDDETYQGVAHLNIFRDASGEWRIHQWLDFRRGGSPLPSWTLVRGENRAGLLAPPEERPFPRPARPTGPPGGGSGSRP